jgi:hypothetical protein
MGWSVGGQARTPSRTAPEPTHLEAGPLGDSPFCPCRWRERRGGVHWRSATSPISPGRPIPWCHGFFCPCAALTEHVYPTIEPISCGYLTNPLGVLPFPVLVAAGEEKRGSGGREKEGEGGGRTLRRHWCAKTEGPSCSCGAVPIAAREVGAVRDGREAGAEQGAGHRREHLHRTTVFVRPVTTTPPLCSVTP